MVWGYRDSEYLDNLKFPDGLVCVNDSEENLQNITLILYRISK